MQLKLIAKRHIEGNIHRIQQNHRHIQNIPHKHLKAKRGEHLDLYILCFQVYFLIQIMKKLNNWNPKFFDFFSKQ